MLRICVLATTLLASAAMAEEQVPMKAGAGLDETRTSCGICHTLTYIRMNSTFLSPDAWKAEVAKMRDAFGAPIDDDTAAVIVKYLSGNYGVAAKS
jgi:hypothetical protein